MIFNEESKQFHDMIHKELNPIKNKLINKYRGTEGFIGTGIGIDKTNFFCIVVYVYDLTAPIVDDLKDLGMIFDGINVEIKEVGEIIPAVCMLTKLSDGFNKHYES